MKLTNSVLFSPIFGLTFLLMTACQPNDSDIRTASEIERVNTQEPSVNSLKIAYIQNDSLAENYTLLSDRLEALQKKMELAGEKLQTKAQRLQGEVIDFQKKAQGGMLSRNDIKKEEQRLQQKQVALQQEQQQQSQKLMLEEAQVKEEVYVKIKDFLNNYVEDKGYDFVLGYQPGSTIWYAKDHLDITADVLAKLNEEYQDSLKK